MTGRRRCTRGFAPLIAAGLALALSMPAHANAAVKPPEGAAKPPPGSGIGTTAALNNPRCNHDDPRYGVYGRFNSTTVGGGPICVKPWKEGDDNGGSTAPGVTKDKVTVVAVVPNDQQVQVQATQGGTPPTNRQTQKQGTYRDAVYDYMLPYMKFYETWGRDVEIVFVESSGSDEAAQRADVVKIKALKPFAVLDISPVGLDVIETEIAKSKILVFGYGTTAKKATEQAPYRWGQTDAQAAAINAAEFVGKQMAGKRAEFAGDPAMQKQKRKFGVVYIENGIDIDQFKQSFKRFGGEVVAENSYQGPGSTVGDATLAQEQAPVIAAKMKSAGVSNIILFTDVAMTSALTGKATELEYFPEWTITGALYQDLAILSRNYDEKQWAHAFGFSNLSPYIIPPATTPQSTNVLDWYWGPNQGNTSVTVPSFLTWVLNGIHTAGPTLTTKTFQQGMFSVPATGGAASDYPSGFQTGYGKTVGLPYDEYLQLGTDFAPVWADVTSTGYSAVTGTQAKGVTWYVDGGKRYRSGTWPTKPIKFFDKSNSIDHFDTSPLPPTVFAGVCPSCPSQGGPGAGAFAAPSQSGFTVPAGGAQPGT